MIAPADIFMIPLISKIIDSMISYIVYLTVFKATNPAAHTVS